MHMAGFEQATIKIEKTQEFEELKGAILRVVAADRSGKFLKRVQGRGLRVRDLDAVIAKGVLDREDAAVARAGAAKLYQALTVSDRAQLKEFYLTQVEEVDQAMRHKFKKIYQYY